MTTQTDKPKRPTRQKKIAEPLIVERDPATIDVFTGKTDSENQDLKLDNEEKKAELEQQPEKITDLKKPAKPKKTPKKILESNSKYIERFKPQSVRLHLINDNDLIEAIKNDENSFNSVVIELLRKHYDLADEGYLKAYKANTEEKINLIRKGIAYIWNSNRYYQTNLSNLADYLKKSEGYQLEDDGQTMAIIQAQLDLLGFEKGII